MMNNGPSVFATCVFYSLIFTIVNSCGGITHIEISYRALHDYVDTRNHTSYDTIIRQNQDALEAGSSYPDSFYDSICFNGRYHNVSEDTHWTPFLNASINYIRHHYPKPWNAHTQKLVAFLMGIVSHQVADISWHSLGIPQGFLRAMASTNYHNQYSVAHSDGDLGGDVLNLFQMNLTYSDLIGEWYVPTIDLKTIYDELYGQNRINETIIESCSQIMYLAKIAEKLAVKKYFPISATKSPFLVDNLYDYFVGGIEDMAGWTRRIWKDIAYELENGQKDCEMPENPLYIRCNKKNDFRSNLGKKRPSSGKSLYTKPNLGDAVLSDVEVIRNGKGITLKPGKRLLEKIKQAEETLSSLTFESEMKKDEEIVDKTKVKPEAVLTVPSQYARFGSAFAIGDLDHDGNDDIVIGAPGFYSLSGQQTGMVFIMYGSDNGLNISETDIYEAADIRIPGPESERIAQTQFGSSLAIFDFDKDGKLDIAIGAPSFGSENLTYVGKVYIFSVLGKNKFSLRAEVTCKDTYCTLGSSLTTGDVNSDLFHDLIVASAFAPGGGSQRGLVGIVKADGKYRGQQGIEIPIMSFKDVMHGSQNYSWFGKSVDAKSFGPNQEFLAVGEPNFRKCARSDCAYDAKDIQSIGRLHVYNTSGNVIKPNREIQGSSSFQMFGEAISMGRPYDKFTNVIAVSMTGNSVKGHIDHIPIEFSQVGSVILYNVSNLYQYPLAVFNGNRRFGRFGAQLKFADLNKDGYDDLIIGAPLRTKDITEELLGSQQGAVYVFYGGKDFPKGDATNRCGLYHHVEPCPAKKADLELVLGENHARFGSQTAVVKSLNKIHLLVTAAHSSAGGRLSGAIAVFNF